MDEANSRSSDVETGEAATGAAMCETRDLGIRWPQWHTLMFSDEIKVETEVGMFKRCLKRCWCRGPDQCTGKSGQQSASMKS